MTWIEHVDHESGSPFYYNKETEECVWETPPGFVPPKRVWTVHNDAATGKQFFHDQASGITTWEVPGVEPTADLGVVSSAPHPRPPSARSRNPPPGWSDSSDDDGSTSPVRGFAELLKSDPDNAQMFAGWRDAEGPWVGPSDGMVVQHRVVHSHITISEPNSERSSTAPGVRRKLAKESTGTQERRRSCIEPETIGALPSEKPRGMTGKARAPKTKPGRSGNTKKSAGKASNQLLCEHGRVRKMCRPCGESSICEHGKDRLSCKACHTNGICEHGKKGSRCRQCIDSRRSGKGKGRKFHPSETRVLADALKSENERLLCELQELRSRERSQGKELELMKQAKEQEICALREQIDAEANTTHKGREANPKLQSVFLTDMATTPTAAAAVGWRVNVFWEEEQETYTGVVVKFAEHQGSGERHAILYDDDDCVFWSDLELEQVAFVSQIVGKELVGWRGKFNGKHGEVVGWNEQRGVHSFQPDGEQGVMIANLDHGVLQPWCLAHRDVEEEGDEEDSDEDSDDSEDDDESEQDESEESEAESPEAVPRPDKLNTSVRVTGSASSPKEARVACLRVKWCTQDGAVRAVDLPNNLAFDELQHKVCAEYSGDGSLRTGPLPENPEAPLLSYTDEEGDSVSILNDSDWLIALEFALREKRTLKIKLSPNQQTGSAGGNNSPSSQQYDTRRQQSRSVGVRDGYAHGGEGTIRWQRGELLGQGSFGKVYSGLDLRTGRLIAVKQVRIGKSEEEEKEMHNLEKEVHLMQLLDHPNIIKYLGTERGKGVLNILLEFAPGGSIKGVLNQFGPFSEAVIRRYVGDVVCGLTHLHAEGIIHRDLKPANMLLEQSGVCKLADFGCSKIIADVLTMMHSEAQHTAIGTMQFMAPEVVKDEGYGRSADIWSLGMSIIEMATGTPPWPTAANAVYKLAMTDDLPDMPEHLSGEAKHLLSLCFQRDPIKRPEARLLQQHEFMHDSEDPMLLESIQANVKLPSSGSEQPTFASADFGPPSGLSEDFYYTGQYQPSMASTARSVMRSEEVEEDALAAALRGELEKELMATHQSESWSGHQEEHVASEQHTVSSAAPSEAPSSEARTVSTDMQNFSPGTTNDSI